MKPFTLILTMLILLGTAAHASTVPDEPLPQFGFALDVVGTAQFDDIDHLKKGMMRADGAEGVRVTRSSHNFTRIRGTFQGKREHFERDLAGLTQDRFSMRITEGEGGTVVVTLTKLRSL